MFTRFFWQSFWIVGIPFGVLGILAGWALHSRDRVKSQRFWFQTIAGTLLGLTASLLITGVRLVRKRAQKASRADRADR